MFIINGEIDFVVLGGGGYQMGTTIPVNYENEMIIIHYTHLHSKELLEWTL